MSGLGLLLALALLPIVSLSIQEDAAHSLLRMLNRIKHSYEGASPDAELLLEELIAQLRERLNAVSASVGPSP